LSAANKIFVTGANGNQGSAAVKNLLSKGFYVKALVRKPTSSKLNSRTNLEIIKGDLDDVNSYRAQLSDCDGVFCLLTYIHGVNKEIKQGFDVVNAAKENGVKHFVYSSVIGCDLNTGIPHWESKNRIEEHIKGSGMDYTILRPTSLYENMLMPQVKSRILKGKLVLPTKKHTVQQFISSEDVGKIATKVFSDPGMYQSKTINLQQSKWMVSNWRQHFQKQWEEKLNFNSSQCSLHDW
jgi:uncharacterized protein YbjT (DUF2867 family)